MPVTINTNVNHSIHPIVPGRVASYQFKPFTKLNRKHLTHGPVVCAYT